MLSVVMLVIVSLLACVTGVAWFVCRRKARHWPVPSMFSAARCRKLSQQEQDAVADYLAQWVEHIGEDSPLLSYRQQVYTICGTISRYGLSTDAPNKWRYYLDSTEIHLPPFWEQFVAPQNQLELVITAGVPLVISLNGHRLTEWTGEAAHVTRRHAASQSVIQEQSGDQIDLLCVRRETKEEHALNHSCGWFEAIMVSLGFLLFFLCLKVPDIMIPWLVASGSLSLLAGMWRIFLPGDKNTLLEVHCLRGTPKRWGLFGESNREQLSAISLGTLDLIYPPHWQPFLRYDLGQVTEIDIYPDRRVVRQGRFLSLHDEVRRFPLQRWRRNALLSLGSFAVLVALIAWVPLEMPFMLTASWLKGAQIVNATSVQQLEGAALKAGDTLRIHGSGMCSIHPGTWSSHRTLPFAPFDCSQIIWNSAHPMPLPMSDIVDKASALIQEVGQQLHPRQGNFQQVNPQLASEIQQSGMVLLNNFAAIVLKTQALCTDDEECVRLKNALVNLGNCKNWDALAASARSGRLNNINVLLRPVSAEALDNLINASTAPFFIRETSRAAQALSSREPGGFVIINEDGGDLVEQPYPTLALYDYPAREQWREFQRLTEMLLQTPFQAEGIVTSLRTDSNGTQYIMLHSIPDSTSIWRYIGTTLLLVGLVFCALYNGAMAVIRRQRGRHRSEQIQHYYEQCLNVQPAGGGMQNLFDRDKDASVHS